MSRYIFSTILITAALLSGCAAAPIIFTGVSVGSVAISETTGRTATDHVVSAVAQQDCRVGRAFRDEPMCRPEGTVRIQTVTTGVTPSTIEEIESKYR
jgi:predicted regulator of amino acid metabolism with ACT domain